MLDLPNSTAITPEAFDDEEDDPTSVAEPSTNIKKAARDIASRCLQRWDGFLGVRASTDSLGRKSGVWRDKYESVRYASLLLAFRKFNVSLASTQPGNSGECNPELVCSIVDMGF